MVSKGNLVCVGTGIQLGGQITAISKSHIEQADVVFGILPNELSDEWIASLNSNYVSLQSFYSENKVRSDSYREMVECIMQAVRAGKNVVGAFYGHPGVFAWVPHEAIRLATEEGFDAYMEPGISAEDCLYADLGIDPGATGCQAFETTQFLFYKHQLDPYSLLILWQIGVAGDHTLQTFDSNKKNLELTVQYLNQWYPLNHQVIVYEAPFLPTESVRIDRIPLSELPNTKLSIVSTLVIPPAKTLELDEAGLELFNLTADDLAFH